MENQIYKHMEREAEGRVVYDLIYELITNIMVLNCLYNDGIGPQAYFQEDLAIV